MKHLVASCCLFMQMMFPLCAAAEQVQTTPDDIKGYISADYMRAAMSGGFSNWYDKTVRIQLQLPAQDYLDLEVSHQEHFDDQGTFYGVAYTHTFDDRYYATLNLGGSRNGIFLPEFRADGFLSRKWLDEKRLVTTLGLGYYEARERYIDHSATISIIYYFPVPLIMELGGRFNSSNPGEVFSRRGYAVLTYGESKRHYFTLRYDSGKEAYQLIGSGTAINNFSSHETIISWRQWLSSHYGWNVSANHYRNPSYHRTGVQAGLFYEF